MLKQGLILQIWIRWSIAYAIMKDELGGKIVTKFVGLSPKTYTYLIDDGSEDKKAKSIKKCVTKKRT